MAKTDMDSSDKVSQAAIDPDQDAKASKRKRKAESKQALAKYTRGEAVPIKGLKDRKLKGQLRHNERLVEDATKAASKIDQWLLPESAGELEAEGMERTWRFAQEDIVREVETGAAAKVFDLSLPQLGPYSLDFTRSGRHVALAGRKGHLAVLDWKQARLVTEIQVRETVRDIKFLHNEMFFAAAQKKYVYIYDKRGLEIHCLREHRDVRRLEFLPYHFLLASIGRGGFLRYQDTSTGEIAACLPTRMGTCEVMRLNPWNACLALGHPNGVVTMWSPNMATPLIRMLCHKGPVTSIAIDPMGRRMATAGVDGDIKIWDIRNFKTIHTYFSHAPASNLEMSQQGILAVGFGSRVQLWKDALDQKQQSPYMSHVVPGAVGRLQFCPYEDVLGVGHAEGFSTMLVPGAGLANFDSWVADPYQSKRARREQEVHQLLDKLKPDMIVLDPSTIGKIQKEPKEIRMERAEQAREASAAKQKAQAEKNDEKTKMKGKNRPSRKYRKKKSNIIEDKKGDLKQRIRSEMGLEDRQKKETIPSHIPRALHRFYKRGNS